MKNKLLAYMLIISLMIGLMPAQSLALDNGSQPSTFGAETQNNDNDKTNSGEVNRYLIGFKNQTGKTKAENKGRLQHQFKHTNILLADLDETAKNDLANDPDIEFIEPDALVQAESLNIELTSWGYTALDTAAVHEQGYLGQGVKIAVLDTGIDLTHPDLRTEPGISFVGASYQDDNGHGTQVTPQVPCPRPFQLRWLTWARGRRVPISIH